MTEKDVALCDVWISKCQIFVALKHFSTDAETLEQLHYAVSRCWWEQAWLSAYLRWLKGWGVGAEFLEFLKGTFLGGEESNAPQGGEIVQAGY